MTTLLIEPFQKRPVAAIEETEQGKNLKFLDHKFKRGLEITGITLSKKRHGLWRVFPDGDGQIFLEAFENDLFNHGLKQKGYYWMSKEDYDDQDKWLAKIVQSGFEVS